MKSAIVVFAENGVVSHKFCTKEVASAMLKDAEKSRAGISTFEVEFGDAGFVYSVSLDFRNRVERAESKLREDLQIQAVLDKHGVPDEPVLRGLVMDAYRELLEGPEAVLAIRNALAA